MLKTVAGRRAIRAAIPKQLASVTCEVELDHFAGLALQRENISSSLGTVNPLPSFTPSRPEGRRKREVPPPRHPKRAAIMGEYDRQQRLQAMASAMNAADATTMDEYRAETAEWEELDSRQ